MKSLLGPTSVARILMTLLCVSAPLFALPGCSSADDSAASDPVCGNGRIESGEVCDGSAFGAAACTDLGFDGGSLACSSDCKAVDSAGCVYFDTDNDGVLDKDEVAAGTDPAAPDTDGDGFTDGEEVAAQTNPTTIDSWPLGLGRWPDRSAAVPPDGFSPNGWDKGDMARFLSLTDQAGLPIELYQFYGYNIVLAVSARWCGPCNEAASTAEDLWMEYKDKGVIFIDVLFDGSTPGKAAKDTDLTYWANKYGLQFPVAMRRGPSTLNAAVTALPTFIFIDRTMKIVKFDEGFGGDSAIKAQLDKMP